jgi:hypothetical protein
MKAKLKEDPREWRKSTLLTVLPLALLSSILLWRHVIGVAAWVAILAMLVSVAIAVCVRPRWFRGYYRVSTRAGFALSQVVARVLLAIFFVVLITPLALVMRLAGKDALRLKRARGVDSYWVSSKPISPLDRLF